MNEDTHVVSGKNGSLNMRDVYTQCVFAEVALQEALSVWNAVESTAASSGKKQ